jgi:RAP1 GTPase activating protein 1
LRAEPRAQFSVIEFDPDTFRTLLDYLHTGSCPLTCSNIPGLICAAEHYDLPELLQACFHHAKQFLRIEVVSLHTLFSTRFLSGRVFDSVWK